MVGGAALAVRRLTVAHDDVDLAGVGKCLKRAIHGRQADTLAALA